MKLFSLLVLVAILLVLPNLSQSSLDEDDKDQFVYVAVQNDNIDDNVGIAIAGFFSGKIEPSKQYLIQFPKSIKLSRRHPFIINVATFVPNKPKALPYHQEPFSEPQRFDITVH